MNRHSSAILAVVITFFVTLALNTGLNLVSSYNGSIRIGAPVRVGSERMFPITIKNYSAKFLDGLALLFPAGITPSDLVADGPVTVTSGAQSGDSQIIRVGQISPRKVTTINIRLPEGRHFEMVQILNPSELGVSLRETTGVESPLRKILIAAGSSALIYTAIAIFFAHLKKMK